MKKTIVTPYFPQAFKYIAPVPAIAGVYLLSKHMFLFALVLMVVAIVMLTTKYVTEIDRKENCIRDYIFFLGLHLSKDVSYFKNLDHIIVMKGSYAHHVNTRVQSRTMRWSDYTGTLLYDKGQTLDLLTNTSKKELILGLKPFADFLDVRVEDHTLSDPYFVDLNKV